MGRGPPASRHVHPGVAPAPGPRSRPLCRLSTRPRCRHRCSPERVCTSPRTTARCVRGDPQGRHTASEAHRLPGLEERVLLGPGALTVRHPPPKKVLWPLPVQPGPPGSPPLPTPRAITTDFFPTRVTTLFVIYVLIFLEPE